MSETSKSWYLLGTVVDDFIDDNNLHNGMWMKCLKWGQRAVRSIRLDSNQQPKTYLLNVTERNSVVLPDAYVDWTKIGVKRGQYVVTLAINDELNTLTRTANSSDTVRGLLSQHLPNGLDFNAYGGYYFYDYNGGVLSGYGCGLPSKGFVKFVDHGDCKELLLDYDYRFDQVLVECITDGIDPCKETVIHPYEYDYIMAYMEEKLEKKYNPKATFSSKIDAEQNTFWEEKKMRARFNDMGPKDILVMSRAETRLTPKI